MTHIDVQFSQSLKGLLSPAGFVSDLVIKAHEGLPNGLPFLVAQIRQLDGKMYPTLKRFVELILAVCCKEEDALEVFQHSQPYFSSLEVSQGWTAQCGEDSPATMAFLSSSEELLLVITTSASSSNTMAFHRLPRSKTDVNFSSTFPTSTLSSPPETLYSGDAYSSEMLSGLL